MDSFDEIDNSMIVTFSNNSAPWEEFYRHGQLREMCVTVNENHYIQIRLGRFMLPKANEIQAS